MRQKKYNPLKLAQKRAQTKVHDNALVFVQGIPTTLRYNRRSKLLNHHIDTQLVSEVNHARFKWNVTMAVLSRHNGEDHVDWDELTVSEPVLQSDLADILKEFHQGLLDECVNKNPLRFAWIACPSDNKLSDDEMYSIFKRLKGFEDEIFPQSNQASIA